MALCLLNIVQLKTEERLMSKAKEVLEELEAVKSDERATRKKVLTQFAIQGNTRRPMGDTIPTIESLVPGVYNVGCDLQGVYFNIAEQKTDELLRFDDERYQTILNEVNKFWTLESNFRKVGFTMKRGILLHGGPGCGKSCLIKLLQEDAVEQGHLVFVTNDIYSLVSVLKAAKEIEPDRNVMCVLEDVDTLIQYGGENRLLELFDGPDQQDKICYVGTTNYIDKLPPRVLRSGRFDRKLEILNPPKAGRLAYLQAKLGVNETEKHIDELADKTDGFSFGDLREFVVSVFCLEYDEAETIERIKSGGVMEGLEDSFLKVTGYQDMSESSIEKALSNEIDESMPVANGLIAMMNKSGREDIFIDFEKDIQGEDS